MNTIFHILWYIMCTYLAGIVAFILISIAYDIWDYRMRNKSWKGFSTNEIYITYEISWGSWLSVLAIVEDWAGNYKLNKKRK